MATVPIPWRTLIASLYGRAYNTTCPLEVKPHGGRATRPDGHYSICNISGTLHGRECRLISIGLGDDFYFEDFLSRYGCEVHGFDPTYRLRGQHSGHAMMQSRRGRRMHFHFAGLGANPNSSICKVRDVGRVPCTDFAEAHNVSLEKRRKRRSIGRRLALQTSFSKYGDIAADHVYPLDVLLRKASVPESAKINVLKVDCEGCEWDAFDHLVKTSPQLLARVEQLVLELHLRVQFMLTGMDQLERMLRHLYLDHGFRVFRSDPSSGFVGALSHTQAPADLVASGFETTRWVAVELSLIRPWVGRHGER